MQIARQIAPRVAENVARHVAVDTQTLCPSVLERTSKICVKPDKREAARRTDPSASAETSTCFHDESDSRSFSHSTIPERVAKLPCKTFSIFFTHNEHVLLQLYVNSLTIYHSMPIRNFSMIVTF